MLKRRVVLLLQVVQNDDGYTWTFPQDHEPFGGDVVDQLCSFLINDRHKNHYVVAHNLRVLQKCFCKSVIGLRRMLSYFQGFDGYFIMNWLIKNNIVPTTILNGGKILQMDIGQHKIKFRDSLNFNPQSLAQWPSTFGIPDLSKGVFPHRFNRPGNWDNIVPYPSLADFGFELKSSKDRAKWLAWYEMDKTEKGGVYDFRKEIVSYCRLDVEVLRRCVQQFRTLFKTISRGLDPMVTSLTMAGLCNQYWRMFHLKPDQVEIVNSRPLHLNRKQSKEAIAWIMQCEKDDSCHIQHAKNGGEKKIGPYFVDGYCATTNCIYEYYGC